MPRRSSSSSSKRKKTSAKEKRRRSLRARLHPTLTATSVDPVARETARAVRMARRDQPPIGKYEQMFLPIMKRVAPTMHRKREENIAREVTQWKPYDILDTIDNYDSCGKGCYLSPGQQELLLSAFEKAGYFSQAKTIDTSVIAKHVATNPDDKPPIVINFAEYKSLVTGKGSPPGAPSLSRSLSEVAKTHHLVFVVFATLNFGGGGAGEWYCKGNLFSYLLCLRYRLPAMQGRGLLIIDPNLVSPREALDALPMFEATRTPLMLCNIADGVYSGSEANLTANWWSTGAKVYPAVAKMTIFTPICEYPSRRYTHSIICGSDANIAAAAELDVPLVATLCVPSRLNQNAATVSFVLPFKIADAMSLKEYYYILTKANPDFSPSYRLHKMCSDLMSPRVRAQADKRHLDFRASSSSDLPKLVSERRRKGADSTRRKRRRISPPPVFYSPTSP